MTTTVVSPRATDGLAANAVDAVPAGAQTATAGSGTRAPAGTRDLFIDSMRAVALLRVFLLHLFGFIWLPLLFPSMSLMFAMAGSLMARSLDRRRGQHWAVLRDRLRRLLPPLWLMGVILVPVMLLMGWTQSWPDADQGFNPGSLVFWVVPFQQPPGSIQAEIWVSPLWYLRTYLWFMLISPALLWMFRRWPRRVLSVPLLVVAMFGLGVYEMGNSTSYELRNFAVYMVAWLVGFAHHDGMLHRVRGRFVVLASAAMVGLGVLLMLEHSSDIGAWNLEMHPAPLMLHGVAGALLVMRFSPSMQWAAKVPGYVRLIAGINARAITIYLWGNVAISLTFMVTWLDPFGGSWEGGWSSYAMTFGVASGFLLVLVMATGWAEDLAARRKPRLLPV